MEKIDNIFQSIKEQFRLEYTQPEFWTKWEHTTQCTVLYNYEPGVETLEGYRITQQIPLPRGMVAHLTLDTFTGIITTRVKTQKDFDAIPLGKCQIIRDHYVYKQIEEIE